jgi:two-component system nitrogen regulation response regulator GlnG
MEYPEYKTINEAIEKKLDQFFDMHGNTPPESGLYDRVINEVERILIKKTIQYTGDIHSRAAKILGINRNTLRKKIKDLGI